MKKEKRRFGDRKDAKLCRDISGFSQILNDLKPKRSLSEVHINQKMDVTKLVKYLDKKRSVVKDGDYKVSYFHAFCTLIGKVIYNRPYLNRFVANRHIYEHNDVVLSYVMKVAFEDKSEEIMALLKIEPNDNIDTICQRTAEKVEKVRKHGDTGEGANDVIQVIGKLPNLVRVPLIALFKRMDQKGWLPESFVQDNIYYSSMIVSNLGTLHCGGIYHNITDFGTCSGIITMGEIKEEIVDGKKKYYCEFGVTLDERIADGYYMVKSLHLMQYILDNPELLEGNANDKINIE